jgi:hypothetical protein
MADELEPSSDSAIVLVFVVIFVGVAMFGWVIYRALGGSDAFVPAVDSPAPAPTMQPKRERPR